jgi:hypothetical protein
MRYFHKTDYFTKLKFPFDNILKKDVVLDDYFHRHDTWGLKFIPVDELIDDDVKNFFMSIDLPLRTIYLMYGPAHESLILHVDGFIDENGQYQGMLCGLNFIFGSTSHVMKWYSSDTYGQTSINKEGLKRTKWDLIDCKIEKETTITAPTLVRTDVPHNVVNLSDQKRFCVSLRFLDQSMTYEQAKNKLELWCNYERSPNEVVEVRSSPS